MLSDSTILVDSLKGSFVRRRLLHSKIHRATVTDANLNYVGSISIDVELLRAANILPYEPVAIIGVDNGNRFETYAIEGKSGEICLNGAAARLVSVGDKVIILAYGDFDSSELEGHAPTVVHVDDHNQQTSAH